MGIQNVQRWLACLSEPNLDPVVKIDIPLTRATRTILVNRALVLGKRKCAGARLPSLPLHIADLKLSPGSTLPLMDRKVVK